MATDTQDHVCASCLKAYQRHDLLLRHRRRCRGLKKRPTRQKACNACVQAKAKCTYVQPCARCDGRGVPCTYAYQPSSPDAYQTSYQEVQDTYLEDPHHPGWLAGVDIGGDLPVLQPAQSLTRTPNFTNAGQPPNVQHPTQGVLGGIIPSHATGESFALLEPVPTTDLVDLRSHGSTMQYSLPHMIHVLDQYPRQLLRDDFTPPCLHRTLYDEDVPDIATLARTSMAVCCGCAMETAGGARFARHAMEVERQRLIASYRMYSCMHQWDALHAMLVYSILELRASHAEGDDGWKQKSYSKGLKAPFLVKMIRDFVHSHNLPPGENLTSQSHMFIQTFQQWATTETARRTVFLANIVHFLGNHDPETGETFPYYEPLDDELILNMPLPCSHTLWTTRTEQEWRLTMQYCQSNSSLAAEDLSSAFHLVPGCLTLKYLFANFSTDDLHNLVYSNYGLGSSDELRGFVILCALKQFGHTQPRPSAYSNNVNGDGE